MMRVSLVRVITELKSYRNTYCTKEELLGIDKAIHLLEDNLAQNRAYKALFIGKEKAK